MTQKQLDNKIYELKSFVADKFKDIQMQSASLKNPEDQMKSNQTMTKITDDIADIRKAFGDIKVLESEVPEEDEDDFWRFPFSGTIL